MSSNNPRGFVEHRNLGGNVNSKTITVPVDHLSAPLYAGDPVVRTSGHAVARIPAATTAASKPIYGICRAVLTQNKRPMTFSQPNNGPYIPGSSAGYWAQVNIDRQQTYLVSTDATVTSTLIGQYVKVTANSPNTAAGRSGMQIEVATGTNSADSLQCFQVVEIGANNLDGIVGGENNQDVEVIIADHFFNVPRQAAARSTI